MSVDARIESYLAAKPATKQSVSVAEIAGALDETSESCGDALARLSTNDESSIGERMVRREGARWEVVR